MRHFAMGGIAIVAAALMALPPRERRRPPIPWATGY